MMLVYLTNKTITWAILKNNLKSKSKCSDQYEKF